MELLADFRPRWIGDELHLTLRRNDPTWAFLLIGSALLAAGFFLGTVHSLASGLPVALVGTAMATVAALGRGFRWWTTIELRLGTSLQGVGSAVHRTQVKTVVALPKSIKIEGISGRLASTINFLDHSDAALAALATTVRTWSQNPDFSATRMRSETRDLPSLLAPTLPTIEAHAVVVYVSRVQHRRMVYLLGLLAMAIATGVVSYVAAGLLTTMVLCLLFAYIFYSHRRHHRLSFTSSGLALEGVWSVGWSEVVGATVVQESGVTLQLIDGTHSIRESNQHRASVIAMAISDCARPEPTQVPESLQRMVQADRATQEA